MKQLFILFLLFFTTDSLASGIASNTASAPCTNTTLETYSGNSNLSADWQPNEIKLRWYNNNTLMDVQSSANTCVYDGTLAVPQTAPTRTGYTFAGWTVRPEIDFAATIPTNKSGQQRWSKSAFYCKYWEPGNDSAVRVSCDSDSNFDELQQNEWMVKFEHGTLYGMSLCSATAGEKGQIGTPTNDVGKYCYCKATGYKPTNSDTIYAPTAKLPWAVYYSGYYGDTVEGCVTECTNVCSNSAYTYLTTLFTPVNN